MDLNVIGTSGRRASPDGLLKTKEVCGKCNNLLGQFVLTPYLLHRHGGPQIRELVVLESKRKTIEQLEAEVAHWHVSQKPAGPSPA